MARRTIAFSALAVPVAAASVALAGCGGSATVTSRAPGFGASGMPGEGRVLEDMSGTVSDAVDSLVSNGTITSAQKDAVVEAIGAGMEAGRPAGGAAPPPGPEASPPAGREPAAKAQAPGAGDLFISVLDSLVSDGTITRAQADAISEALDDAVPDMPGARSPPADASQS